MPDGEPSGPDLDDEIGFAIMRFEEAVDDQWDDPVAGASINQLADKLATIVTDASDSLLVERYQHVLRELPELLSDLDIHEEVRQALQSRLAREYCSDTRGMSRRCLELTSVVLQAAPREA